jgi:hypothetical protein
VKQRLPGVAARGTATPVGGVVGLYSKLTSACTLIRLSATPAPRAL